MAFVKFKTIADMDVLINVDQIVDVRDRGITVSICMTFAANHVVRGTFDEVMARLGDATDVYIDERAPEADEVPA